MNQFNPIPDELLEKAKEQQKEYYLDEMAEVRVPLRRDLVQLARRALAVRGQTVEQAVSEYLTKIAEEGGMQQ